MQVPADVGCWLAFCGSRVVQGIQVEGAEEPGKDLDLFFGHDLADMRCRIKDPKP